MNLYQYHLNPEKLIGHDKYMANAHNHGHNSLWLKNTANFSNDNFFIDIAKKHGLDLTPSDITEIKRWWKSYADDLAYDLRESDKIPHDIDTKFPDICLDDDFRITAELYDIVKANHATIKFLPKIKYIISGKNEDKWEPIDTFTNTDAVIEAIADYLG